MTNQTIDNFIAWASKETKTPKKAFKTKGKLTLLGTVCLMYAEMKILEKIGEIYKEVKKEQKWD